MPDERQDSIRKGIHSPDESPTGREAAERNREEVSDAPAIGGGMGGTSDADRPADESLYEAQRSAAGQEGDAAEEAGGADQAAATDQGDEEQPAGGSDEREG